MILELWKPFGITSNEFVRQYKLQYNLDNICYAGRLDPLAQGTMLILTNEDTKQMKNFLEHNKTYQFELILGVSTESHDCLSNITNFTNVNLDKEYIKQKLEEFTANYNSQEFPIVSSLPVLYNGVKKPLWWFYSNGIKDVVLPKKQVKILDCIIFDIDYIYSDNLKNIFINRIETIKNQLTKEQLKTTEIVNQWNDFNKNINCISIKIKLSVSTGFYIRQFCNDFGKFINIPSMTLDITRTICFN